MGTIQSQTKKPCWDGRNERELKNEAKLIAKKKYFLARQSSVCYRNNGKGMNEQFLRASFNFIKMCRIIRRRRRSFSLCGWMLMKFDKRDDDIWIVGKGERERKKWKTYDEMG